MKKYLVSLIPILFLQGCEDEKGFKLNPDEVLKAAVEDIKHLKEKCGEKCDNYELTYSQLVKKQVNELDGLRCPEGSNWSTKSYTIGQCESNNQKVVGFIVRTKDLKPQINTILDNIKNRPELKWNVREDWKILEKTDYPKKYPKNVMKFYGINEFDILNQIFSQSCLEMSVYKDNVISVNELKSCFYIK